MKIAENGFMLSIIPNRVYALTIVLHDNSLTMLESDQPASLILLTILPRENSLTMSVIVSKVTFELFT